MIKKRKALSNISIFHSFNILIFLVDIICTIVQWRISALFSSVWMNKPLREVDNIGVVL